MPPAPTAYPLLAPVVSGNTITVDEALATPSRITREIATYAEQRMFIQRIFTPSGRLSGGALLYERPNAIATDLYSDREVKEVAPGEEFPLLTFSRGVPMVARPRKIGGKWFVTREARLRNDQAVMNRQMVQTANTINRRVELLGLAEMGAVVTAESRFRTGTSWSAYAAQAPDVRTGTAGPVADILAARLQVDLEERGNSLTGAILHPNQEMAIGQAYGFGNIAEALRSAGITEYYSTPRQTAGTVTLYSPGQTGEMRLEFPLAEEVWEDAEGRQRTWYQWSVSPMFVIVDQFAMLEIRGVA